MQLTGIKRLQLAPWTGGSIDAALYSKDFTGRAQFLPHCRHFCLSDTHAPQECHYAPIDDAPPQPKVTRGSTTVADTRQPRFTSRSGVKLCGLFNKAEGQPVSLLILLLCSHMWKVVSRPTPSGQLWQAAGLHQAIPQLPCYLLPILSLP